MLINKKWYRNDFIGLTVIPLEFLLGTLVIKIPFIKESILYSTIINTTIFTIGFLVMIYLFKDFLRNQWHLYRENRFWLKIIMTIFLVIGSFLVLSIVRMVLPQVSTGSGSGSSNANLSVGLIFISSIPPFLAAFAEELTFRHLLFMKIKPKWCQFLMFFGSSILFGLIHLNNFNGSWVATIPYMFIGAYFALIYYFSKNIWNNIIVHLIFNSINSIIPAIFLLILHLLGLY